MKIISLSYQTLNQLFDHLLMNSLIILKVKGEEFEWFGYEAKS